MSRSSTTKLAKHIPSGFTYDHVTYRGENVAETFVQHILQIEDRLINILRNSKPLQMLREDEMLFQKATHCHI